MKQECPFDEGTQARCLRTAARKGFLAVLEWLRKKGCKLNGELYYRAAKGGHTHVLTYLHRMRAPTEGLPIRGFSDSDTEMDVLMFLLNIGVQIPEEMKQEVVQAMRAHCTFHGLIRWCRKAVSDPSRAARDSI